MLLLRILLLYYYKPVLLKNANSSTIIEYNLQLDVSDMPLSPTT